ncbi:argininosuccinate synthase-related protein [Thaumasiovibrio subtropicus]|uniref:argininosuccinate synthase-related protein n=1 Tax=Thaumasiovibrio subtropicus TaxID=1891207 RepID=UPI000B34CD7A|nr:argininosuccinate synthase-related protein [Thaumasiovibrio subtropicus]
MKLIRSAQDLKTVSQHTNHVLTLFSGGLDSSYLLAMLSELPVKVTALAVDLGDEIDHPRLKQICEHFDAELLVVDAKHTFIQDAVVPAIQAQAKYLGLYPISSSLSRPVIVKHAVEVAERLECGAIIHTANLSQNSLRRLNGSIEQSGYQGFYGSPYQFTVLSREQKKRALATLGLGDFKERCVSGDSNLWCREYESGILDNPECFFMPEGLYQWCRYDESKQLHQDNHLLTVCFRNGVPISVNNISMPIEQMVGFLNRVVGAYQIGQYSGLEHLAGGQKVLEVREAPAAKVLMEAYRHLETAIHPASLLQQKMILEQQWVMEAVEGRWGSTIHTAARDFINATTENVSGIVTFQLHQGGWALNAVFAENALYLKDRDAWEAAEATQQSRADIQVQVNPSKIWA